MKIVKEIKYGVLILDWVLPERQHKRLVHHVIKIVIILSIIL